MADDSERVRIWNAFFELAWTATKRCADIGLGQPAGIDLLGGNLDDDRRVALGALGLTALAIDARSNHLIDSLVDDGIIKDDTARAAKWMPPKHKWFLLPALANKSTKLSSSADPHQAISQILSRRNDVMHAKFDEISKLCPSSSEMVGLWNRAIVGLEDMNVVLDRIPSPRAEFLDKARL